MAEVLPISGLGPAGALDDEPDGPVREAIATQRPLTRGACIHERPFGTFRNGASIPKRSVQGFRNGLDGGGASSFGATVRAVRASP
jgi:hypothetical protein